MTERDTAPAWIDRVLARITLFSSRHAHAVLAASAVFLALTWGYASRLEIRGDFLDLLPTQSEGARLFRATLDRMGGGSSTLLVMVRSPDRDANRRLVDAIEPQLRALPPRLVRTVEHGPEETRRFFHDHRWLYASVGDLEEVSCELSRSRRRMQPGFVDLDDDSCASRRSDYGIPDPDAEDPAPSSATETPAATPSTEPPSALPFARFRAQIARRVRDVDRFPTGYFCDAPGTLYAVVIRSPGTGTGDRSGDDLMDRVRSIVNSVHPTRFHPRMVIGYAGDIPNAIAEREAIKGDVVVVSSVAIVLILGAIVVFFRSLMGLLYVGFAMVAGVGVAFAVAMGAFGYLTSSTGFLGSIIAGNGINYAIIYLARYRERRATGDPVEAALLDATRTSRVGTQLASFAAAGAYGSLMLTSFRGFSQFGLIGGVGMLACWVATMTLVPAAVTSWESFRAGRRFRTQTSGTDPQRPVVRAPIATWVGRLTERHAVLVLTLGAVISVAAAVQLPTYLHDPWEYNFSKLGSRGSHHAGAGQWSNQADRLFASHGSPTMLLANTMDEVLPLVAALRRRDQEITHGTYIQRVETIYDRLGGTPAVVARKLEILRDIRDDIDGLMPFLTETDRETAQDWRPPESLGALHPEDLPPLVREQFTERNGTVGTPFFVYFRPQVWMSDGHTLLRVARITQNLRLPDGRVVPTVSRAAVFAEMIVSMGRDGPRATIAAFIAVVLIVVLATRRVRAAVAILASLCCGVLWTVGGAARLDVRLNFLNFVALPLTFGIGVEYAMNLYDRVRYTHGDVTEALRSVGGAVALCSLTTIIGYAALLAADNQALQSFGYYAIAGEFACISTALLILPASLRVLRGRGAPPSVPPS